VVFSVREARDLYQEAVTKAWSEVEARLREVSAAEPGTQFKLVEVGYDALPDESVIEELPDQPKSSRPQVVEVSVRLRATYTCTNP
jgi:hypothetical protein